MGAQITTPFSYSLFNSMERKILIHLALVELETLFPYLEKIEKMLLKLIRSYREISS